MDDKRRARRTRIFDAIRKTPPEPLGPPDTHDQTEVAAMLREIGIALLEVEQPTQLVSARLTEIAAQYTTQPVRIVVLPTVLMIQVGTVGYEVDTSTTYSLQLDMAGRIDDIASLASVGGITPADAIGAITRARNLRPRFGPVATTLGYAVTTIGFGMVINPTWASLPGYLFLGLVVGAIAQLGRPFPSLNPVLPTAAAMVTTMLATWFVADTANDGLLRVIAPALVAMLPGMALTIGAMELASNQLIGGSSRLVYGVAQLALLVFGVALGVHVAGQVKPQTPSAQMGSWSLYVAIVVVAIGLYVYLSAPRGSLVWLAAAIGVALIGQAVAGKFVAAAYSGFIGAFLTVPFAMLAARIKTSPPAIVMMLAAFWALVPGALSFESASVAATGTDVGPHSLGATGAAVLSIALGTVIGWSVFHTIDSRLPWPKGLAQPTVR
ncbi:threonine/serine exporter family protein [Mycolicibacterium vinylchloridicum]|uniref:threonine/serine ThrE exporter family protein n=1 Tax=Mycolicibacterium vinylchloridicum TaxID=2736928 RepID=UPI0015CEBCDB|nr:threonine/serine exporter family protein [Mycolicibacterium vinylchloridicum]